MFAFFRKKRKPRVVEYRDNDGLIMRPFSGPYNAGPPPTKMGEIAPWVIVGGLLLAIFLTTDWRHFWSVIR